MHGQERGHVKNRGVAALLSIIHRIKNVIISWLYNEKTVSSRRMAEDTVF
jgi:hypothetical protein